MFWGFTPPIDVVTEYSILKPDIKKTELNVLIIGNCDIRHVLKTMAKSYKHDNTVHVNFYVYDGLPELLARHMLLLTIALEPSEKLGLREKVWLWMELYGNTLLRPTTANYMVQKAPQMVHMVTDLDFLSQRLPCLNLNCLKYKERDTLENIFRFWMLERFPISKIWDSRLRQNLGTRYDYKDGAFDWDYHMKMIDIKGLKVINSREYISWRKNGVAFSWPEMEYSVPNSTMAIGIVKSGSQYCHLGFYGDMVYGPYYTFGLNCDDKNMLKTINEVHAKRATDITQRNLMEMFHEIDTGTSYDHSVHNNDPNYGAMITRMGTINIDNPADVPRDPPKTKETYTSIPSIHKVIFLSTEKLEGIVQPKFKKFFDIILVSNNLFSKCSKVDGLTELINEDGIFIVDSMKIHFRLEKEKRSEYGDNVTKYFEEHNFEKALDVDPLMDTFFYYQVRTSKSDNRLSKVSQQDTRMKKQGKNEVLKDVINEEKLTPLKMNDDANKEEISPLKDSFPPDLASGESNEEESPDKLLQQEIESVEVSKLFNETRLSDTILEDQTSDSLEKVTPAESKSLL